MHAEPQQEHAWLQKLVGEWSFKGDCTMGPDQPAMTSIGLCSVRSLGGFWILAEGQGDMPGGGPMASIITLGYDPARQRFIGTFVASMMTHLWFYDVTLDGGRRVLTLDTEGPSFKGDGGLVKYQDIIEVKGDDHWVLRSRALGDDGAWGPFFMNADYRRKA
jgi:hypothetical protein